MSENPTSCIAGRQTSKQITTRKDRASQPMEDRRLRTRNFGYFVANLRTFLSIFTGLHNAAVPQNWQMSDMLSLSVVFLCTIVQNILLSLFVHYHVRWWTRWWQILRKRANFNSVSVAEWPISLRRQTFGLAIWRCWSSRSHCLLMLSSDNLI